MTILVDARALTERSPGGVSRVAEGLLPSLVRAMPQDRFVFVTTGLRRPGLPVRFHRHLILPNKLWSALSFLRLTSLDRAFARERPDLLLLPNLGFVGKPYIPYALVVHDISFLIEPRWFSWTSRLWHRTVGAKRLLRGATLLFAVSERTKRDLIERLDIPAERISVIPLALHYQSRQTVPLPAILEGTRYVLALGARDPRKNSACAVAAVEALRQDRRFADVRLILVGRDLGRPLDVALASLMQHAAAFLYPSWYEGFGLPLHEAARFGTPCIASTAGALPETAPQGTLFAPPAKPHLWTEALEMILTDPAAHRTTTAIGDWTSAAEIISHQLKHLPPKA